MDAFKSLIREAFLGLGPLYADLSEIEVWTPSVDSWNSPLGERSEAKPLRASPFESPPATPPDQSSMSCSHSFSTPRSRPSSTTTSLRLRATLLKPTDRATDRAVGFQAAMWPMPIVAVEPVEQLSSYASEPFRGTNIQAEGEKAASDGGPLRLLQLDFSIETCALAAAWAAAC